MIPVKLTKAEFNADLKFIGKLWYYFGITEFPYMDLAYAEMKRTRDKQMEQRLEETSKFKFNGREVMNAYYWFKGGIIENLLSYVSKNFLEGNEAQHMYSDELLAAFDGKKPKKAIIDQRRKCYADTIINGTIMHFPYKEALELNYNFTCFENRSTITGKPITSGVARGKAIIAPMLNDYSTIKKIDNEMKKGDILIAETTSPDILILCKKACAIVAEQGGMLSHAAVVSRELGIPCVIQTEIATRVFKTGDLIEVDANKGIVKKIKAV